MATSRYLERTLFYDLSPTAEEYYTRSADAIFEKDERRSQVEVRLQSTIDPSFYERTGKPSIDPTASHNEDTHPEPIEKKKIPMKSGVLEQKREDATEITTHEARALTQDIGNSREGDDAWSFSSKASSTAPPIGLDHQLGSNPPMYPGPPKLNKIENLNTSMIRSFGKHTQHSFRVFYIRQRNSFSRLQITKEVFEELLSSCHVFPRLKEYVIGLGSKSSDSEVTPLPLKFRPLYESQDNSYHGFECSYLLRYAEHTNRGGDRRPYSFRQFAVYHRYKPNITTGCSTWILIGSSTRTEKRIEEFTHNTDDLMAANPFGLHTVFLDTAIASWLPFLRDLDKTVTYQSNKAVGISVGSDDDSPEFISIDFEDHQEMKVIEDQLAETILFLDSMLDTVTVFRDMYEQFREHHIDASRILGDSRNSSYNTDAVVFGLKEKAREIQHTRKIAVSLLSKVKNTRTLISSLLERAEGYSLQKLAKQGQDENTIMRRLAEKNNRDSSSMRVLTIITMIYLPCTIVSNFYSTQFVNQKELESGGTKLEYTQNTYIFFAISVPLTLLTISIWYVWINSEKIIHLLMDRIKTRNAGMGEEKDVFQQRVSLAELPR
ncbi:unnamed protein product [Periconia digitata]|uniref:CorA-like transporter domain-containing protein n=1 Tax=Periconia digitata TaxID=1303443 RepID=A0A9W4XUF6_9PLEO|nr:unnamed protein product [Periconia digitata]